MVVIDAESGNLGVNNEKQEDDEDDVGDVAGVLPDKIDRRGGVHREWADGGEVINNNTIDSVDAVSEEV